MNPTAHKILLVEDDKDFASLYQSRMEMEGYTVKHCENGEQALQTALEFLPDLIVLDIMMPKVNGFDVLDILHNTAATAKAKVIILSAMGEEADAQRAKELGATEYLVKSQVTLSNVLDRIHFHLAPPQGQTSASS